jgi:uncharacterized protein YndB with AHSA1/START domain
MDAQDAAGALKMAPRDARREDRGATIQVAVPPSSRAGTLTLEGDYATLTFERHFRHPIQIVWDALTEPEHLARWYMTKARLDPREGGSIDYMSGPAQYHVTGKILTWQPPRVFEHEWNVEPRRELPKGEKSIVRWELTPDRDGTVLRITHRRLTRQTATGFVAGIHAFLDRLENELNGEALMDWESRVNQVRANYRQTKSPR